MDPAGVGKFSLPDPAALLHPPSCPPRAYRPPAYSPRRSRNACRGLPAQPKRDRRSDTNQRHLTRRAKQGFADWDHAGEVPAKCETISLLRLIKQGPLLCPGPAPQTCPGRVGWGAQGADAERGANYDHRHTSGRTGLGYTGDTQEDRRILPLWRDHLRGGGRSRCAQHLPLHRLPKALRLGLSYKYSGTRRAFHLLSGTPKTYVKTAESGNKRLHAFCGNCGTPIYACAVDDPQSYGLRVGTIIQRGAFTPKRQGWRRSALHWVDALAAVPASDKG